MKRILLGLDGILTNIEYLLSGNAKRRILAVLLLSAKRFGQKNDHNQIIIQLPLTHQDMANLCGLTRETVSLIIEELIDKKIISSKKQLLTIQDLKSLEVEIEIYKDEASGFPAL
jgi:CRP/FNR family transcriptional regulator